MGQDGAGGVARFETMSMAERRYAQSGKASDWLKKSWPRICEQKPTRFRLLRVDSRSVFFGYSDFTDAVDFKEKQKVPHSYSRAEENARFANGVRDDEIKKDYINPEIAVSFRPIGAVTSGGLASCLFLAFPGALRPLGFR